MTVNVDPMAFATKVELAKTQQSKGLIPDGSNLDDYYGMDKIGTYYVGNVSSCSGIPEEYIASATLLVFNGDLNRVRTTQMLITVSGRVFSRFYGGSDSGWTSWEDLNGGVLPYATEETCDAVFQAQSIGSTVVRRMADRAASDAPVNGVVVLTSFRNSQLYGWQQAIVNGVVFMRYNRAGTWDAWDELVVKRNSIRIPNYKNYKIYAIDANVTEDGVPAASLSNFINSLRNGDYGANKILVLFTQTGDSHKFSDFPSGVYSYGTGIAIATGYYDTVLYVSAENEFYYGRKVYSATTWNFYKFSGTKVN